MLINKNITNLSLAREFFMLRVYLFVLFIVIATGCSNKLPSAGSYEKIEDVSIEKDYLAIGIGYKVPLIHTQASWLNMVIVYPLQIAAEDTLSSGYRYFAIVSPSSISNIKGIMTNTAKEYIDKCANNDFLKSTIILTNPCNIADGDLAYPIFGGSFTYRMYKSRPFNHLTYDALEVIATLKEKEVFYNGERYRGIDELEKKDSMYALFLLKLGPEWFEWNKLKLIKGSSAGN